MSEGNEEIIVVNPTALEAFSANAVNHEKIALNLCPARPPEQIKRNILHDESIRFTSSNYHLTNQTQLIKITALTLPAKEIWIRNSWITLEFKKPIDLPLDLNVITYHLDLLKAQYQIEALPPSNGYDINLIYIHSKNTESLAYLTNLYLEIPTAHLLLKSALSELVEWSTIGEEHHKAKQKISIFLDELNESNSSALAIQCPIISYYGDVDTKCVINKEKQEQELQYIE